MTRFVPVPYKTANGDLRFDGDQLFVDADHIWLIQMGWQGSTLLLHGGERWDVPLSPADAAEYFAEPFVRWTS